MVTRGTLLVAISAASACYSPAFKDCELACSARGTCPDGFECVGQVCRSVGVTTECTAGMPDAPADDSMMADAPGMPGHPSTPWTNPRQVLAVPNGADDPSLTDDRLELFFGSGTRIQVARFVNGTWTNIVTAPGLDPGLAGVSDDAPYVSADGLTMHFMSSRPGGQGGNDIWRATRPNRMTPWEMLTNVQELNTASLEAGGSISGDGLMIVFVSDRAGAVMRDDLYYANRQQAAGPWGPVNRLTELNTSASESHPLLSPDKLTIYFHSDRLTANDFDLYEAHRSAVTLPFGMPRRITELATIAYDGDPWVSLDGRHMFFTRTVGGQKTIWEASR